MAAVTVTDPLAAVSVLPVIDVDGEEILSLFAEVMHEWGFCRTVAGLRFPTLAEARRAAAGRRGDLSRNRRLDGSWIPVP